jgi:hypothetical protein
MNKKDRQRNWKLVKSMKTGSAPLEFPWGIVAGDLTEEDAKILLTNGWMGNQYDMRYRDGLHLYDEERVSGFDRAAEEAFKRQQAAYDRLDEICNVP